MITLANFNDLLTIPRYSYSKDALMAWKHIFLPLPEGKIIENFNFLQKGAEPLFFSKNQKVLGEDGFPHPEVPPKGGMVGPIKINFLLIFVKILFILLKKSKLDIFYRSSFENTHFMPTENRDHQDPYTPPKEIITSIVEKRTHSYGRLVPFFNYLSYTLQN